MVLDTQNCKPYEFGDGLVSVALPVNSFRLEDQQYLKIRIKSKAHNVVVVAWIPRSIVVGIVEGKTPKSAAYSFAGTAQSTKSTLDKR